MALYAVSLAKGFMYHLMQQPLVNGRVGIVAASTIRLGHGNVLMSFDQRWGARIVTVLAKGGSGTDQHFFNVSVVSGVAGQALPEHSRFVQNIPAGHALIQFLMAAQTKPRDRAVQLSLDFAAVRGMTGNAIPLAERLVNHSSVPGRGFHTAVAAETIVPNRLK